MVQPSILKSHTRSKMIGTQFYRFIFHNDWLQNRRWFSLKKMAPNFEAVFSVLLEICSQIYRSMPYLCIFVIEVVPLLEAMTDKLVLTFVCGRN